MSTLTVIARLVRTFFFVNLLLKLLSCLEKYWARGGARRLAPPGGKPGRSYLSIHPGANLRMKRVGGGLEQF